MGLRFRKSMKVAPGVKVNFGKNSMGVSLGGKAGRVSVNTKGRVTQSVSTPISGLSYVKTSKLGGSKKTKKASANNNFSDNFDDLNQMNNSAGGNGGKKGGGCLRWILYLVIVIGATGINEKLCFPGMILAGLIHMASVKKEISEGTKGKKSMVGTVLFLAFALFGTVLNILPTPDIESIKISASETTMDINEVQDISLEFEPKNADIDAIVIELSDGSIAEAVITDDKKIELQTFGNEGMFILAAKSGEVESNKLPFTVVDKERIAAEKKAEEERIAAEKKAEEEKVAAAASASTQAQSNAVAQDNGPSVWITPTGKKYHYNSNCNDGDYFSVTLSQATSRGLTPCKKCAW